jgi:hypothetical protein
MYQDGHSEKTFLFHVDDFDRVAEVVKPRRRKEVSPQERARLVEAGRATRLAPGRRGVQGDLAARQAAEGAPAGPDPSEAPSRGF